ncbi:hypothetical protein RYZ20_08985 [Thioclava sp. A2]|uniref:hypothetical protein n=1 Tax=Thioclava sp. FCG-A2 TaxID=3080562 RepID=UPI002953EFD3|nr:hypothetical protein [Thioclava sp. A2]MDV7271032.1 hypothetical protein [Thioclava sp. A2]
MSDTLEKLQARLSELENQIEAEWDRRRAEMQYRLERGRIVFEEGVKDAHRRVRIGLWRFLRRTRPAVILSAPVIYSVAIPFAVIDLWVTLYQRICFPIYGIARVKRSDHIVFDRHQLAYLNGIQKFNCLYCSYGNGVASYVREVSARTEKYWCPIKHARRIKGPHAYYGEFCDFGDADGFQRESPRLRRELGKGD